MRQESIERELKEAADAQPSPVDELDSDNESDDPSAFEPIMLADSQDARSISIISDLESMAKLSIHNVTPPGSTGTLPDPGNNDKEIAPANQRKDSFVLRSKFVYTNNNDVTMQSEHSAQLMDTDNSDLMWEDTVTFLLYHSALFIRPKHNKEICIIPTSEYSAWTQFRQAGLDGVTPWVESWQDHRIISFIGVEQGHFTLSLLVNSAWDDSAVEKPMPEWTLFHLDPLPDETKNNFPCAHQFSSWILKNDVKNIKATEVPVPPQIPESNDCGFIAVHLFTVFMSNMKAGLDFIQLKSKGLDGDHPDVLSFWKAEEYSGLRRDAKSTFLFHKAIADLSRGKATL